MAVLTSHPRGFVGTCALLGGPLERLDDAVDGERDVVDVLVVGADLQSVRAGVDVGVGVGVESLVESVGERREFHTSADGRRALVSV